MALDSVYWIILSMIGVSDAKAHRIPNQLVLMLLAILFVSCVADSPKELFIPALLNKSAAFFICFLVSLGLYLIRVMAPGDVKLIAVLGFWLGTAQLTDYLFYVSLMTVFVGPMYWALNRLKKAKQVHISAEPMGSSHYSLAGMAVQMEMGKQQLKHTVSTGQGLTYMPFAPILIMGLALQQYYA
ncbi:A24 family peptidase [Vibrio sp. DNB22_17_1]